MRPELSYSARPMCPRGSRREPVCVWGHLLVSSRPLLEVTTLHSGYGRIPVLHGVDLTISDGEVVGILGHNGMGKSTLLKTLMGFVPTTQGQVVFDGEDVTRWAPHRRSRLGLGYVPQGRGIFPQLTVLENLRMGMLQSGHDEVSALDRILDDFPLLSGLLDRRGGNLSGGATDSSACALFERRSTVGVA